MINKAIIPIAGLGTRLLPFSKAVSKEFLPLADRPAIQYILKEALASGIREVIFVIRPGQKKGISEYFKKTPKLEKILKEKKQDELLAEIKELEEISRNLSFFYVIQKEPLGDGQAIFQARKLVNQPAAVFFIDDIIDSKTPGLAQLFEIFRTCQKPIIALKRLPKEKLSAYGVVEVEKIASRVYKIKKIIEKPLTETPPSDLAIVGRYIITPEVFEYLKKLPLNQKGEIILAEALEKMAQDGKVIYGYEIEGEWLEAGDKLLWLKSNFYFSLKHPQLGPELKKFLKKEK